MEAPLWVPSPERIDRARITAFARTAEQACGVRLPDYAALHRFSIEAPQEFWTTVWDFCGVRGERGAVVIRDLEKMPGATFFPDARLNFADNLLRPGNQDREAIIFQGEDRVRRTVTRAALRQEVAECAAALRAASVGAGDRVAAWVPNLPETISAFAAAASLGAIWSSCSPDFGARGVLDRFGQIEPKVLITVDGYYYNGKLHTLRQRLTEVLAELPTVERVIVIPYASAIEGDVPDIGGVRDAVLWPDALRPHAGAALTFEPLPFNHPLYILYSSGTTGPPKCIVHGAGGTLVQHLKEHQLHCDIHSGDRVFYFTTCGWMMWNWLVSALASEATLLLYDGSPTYPGPEALFDFADDTGMTLFGTSARFIEAVRKANCVPRETHSLSTVRTITSTGSPLAPEGFDFVYEHIKSDVHLASISGGTDIVSCFVGGVPTLPVWRGEIQARALGMNVHVFDESGQPVRLRKGELVCTTPFPSMPLGFWNDPAGTKYHAAYFDVFPGVWRHGDWAEVTGHDGVIIYGRSDAVLNPGGVRIGTAEIYRQVEQLDEVVESLAIGQQWEHDERLVLFVRLRDGVTLDDDLSARIRERIRRNATPRHVPARIVQVSDIPRTRSGKIVELAVRDVVHGRAVRNREALANPEALDLFRDMPELQQPHVMSDAERCEIPAAVLAHIVRHAREAAPAECCGLLIGRLGPTYRIDRAIATRNAREGTTQYLVHPEDHFAAIRQARAEGLEIVGGYHSHPNGRPEPSPTDLEEAAYPDMVYLIASLETDGTAIRAFRLFPGNFREVALVTVP